MKSITINIHAVHKSQAESGAMHVDRSLILRATSPCPEMAYPHQPPASSSTRKRWGASVAQKHIWASARKDAMTVEEAANELGLCPLTVRKRCSQGAPVDTGTSVQES